MSNNSDRQSVVLEVMQRGLHLENMAELTLEKPYFQSAPKTSQPHNLTTVVSQFCTIHKQSLPIFRMTWPA